MKYSIAGFMLMLTLSLVGCGNSEELEKLQAAQAAQAAQTAALQEVLATKAAELDQKIKALEQSDEAALLKEEEELAAELKKAQEVDPTIKDIQYTTTASGERALQVVQQNGSQATSMVWPLLGGMAAGALMANMMNSGGGYGGYSRGHSPYSSNSYAYDRGRMDADRARAQANNRAYRSNSTNQQRAAMSNQRMQHQAQTSKLKAQIATAKQEKANNNKAQMQQARAKQLANKPPATKSAFSRQATKSTNTYKMPSRSSSRKSSFSRRR